MIYSCCAWVIDIRLSPCSRSLLGKTMPIQRHASFMYSSRPLLWHSTFSQLYFSIALLSSLWSPLFLLPLISG
uniref:Uncharacterized protein MANES_01G231400 n=1 Tax=Rhizophora mucronata TaxID=61149 RepID=A0A2P2JQX5_RHIMU